MRKHSQIHQHSLNNVAKSSRSKGSFSCSSKSVSGCANCHTDLGNGSNDADDDANTIVSVICQIAVAASMTTKTMMSCHQVDAITMAAKASNNNSVALRHLAMMMKMMVALMMRVVLCLLMMIVATRKKMMQRKAMLTVMLSLMLLSLTMMLKTTR